MVAEVALALVASGCGIATSVMQPAGGGLADAPLDPNAVPPVLKVAEGIGPTGPYRAWVYRVKDGSWCFDVVMASMGSGSCGPDASVLIGPGTAGDPTVGLLVTGGTRIPGAASARVTLASQAQQAVPLVRPGAFVPGDIGVYVIPLPKGETVAAVDILDASGAVLESVALP